MVEGDKEAPDVVSDRDLARFDELRIVGTGLDVIAEPTLDYGDNRFNYPSFSV